MMADEQRLARWDANLRLNALLQEYARVVLENTQLKIVLKEQNSR